jgi:hypothetical protein
MGMPVHTIEGLKAAEQAAFEAYQKARRERLALPEEVEHSVRVQAVENMSMAYGAHERALRALEDAQGT